MSNITQSVNPTNQNIQSPIQSINGYLDACDKFDSYFAEISAKWKAQQQQLAQRIASLSA
ncbi:MULTISPECIES: hypothetical protein [Cysteiniphilum]|uniref:hypothetical protein n=1 Tax=Cysteiniphilum TaxID=2056696 RepID=UPI00177E4C3C|nr:MULTISPECIES: hypothetical protein [Cysteiniphilum]